MAYFENMQLENPEDFVDEEVTSSSSSRGSGRLSNTERDVYEATCREGEPLVSHCRVTDC